MFRSNSTFYLKSTINLSYGIGATFLISTDFELGQTLETGGEEISITLKPYGISGQTNQIERMVITATGGVATIIKRGLTQEDTKVINQSLYKQWTDGSIISIVALASDLIDKDTGLGPVYQNASTRDIAILYPKVGMRGIYLIDEGYYTSYTPSGWQIDGMGTGSTPNATTSIAGLVQIPTPTQVKNGTPSGVAGLVIPTSYIKYCKASKSTDQAGIVDGVVTTITMNTFTGNDVLMGATANQITITADGIYKICGGLRSNLTYEVGAYIRVIILKNGNPIHNVTGMITPSNYVYINFNTIEQLSNSDIITFQYFSVKPTPANSSIESTIGNTHFIVSSL